MHSDNVQTKPEVDEKLLQYLTLVATVLHSHKPDERENNSKHWWQPFVEPSVLVALITVIIGGLFGSAITYMYQNAQKEREFQQSWLKARGDQALTSYKEYLDREQELVKRTYSLIGACISASDRLVSQTGPPFRAKFTDPQRVIEQKQTIKRNFNEVKARWLTEKEEIGLLMVYYHPEHPNVHTAWRKVQDYIIEYLEWAENWNNQFTEEKPPPSLQKIKDASTPMYKDLLSNLSELSLALESARDYPWKGWESPKKMKDLLEVSD